MRAVAFLVVVLLVAPLARAEPSVGDAAPPVLAIAGKQVPLPAGNWIIAGRAPGTVTNSSGLGSYGTIWNLVLFRLSSNGTVDATAEVNVNDIAVADGWGIAADCQRGGLMLTVVRSQSGWNATCFFIAETRWSHDLNLSLAWQQAQAFATQRGLKLPHWSVTAGFRAANRRDIIDARFHFQRGATTDRWRAAHDREIAAWSAMMIGCVEAGLKNRLPISAVPAPGADEATLEQANMLHGRQQRLDYLRSAGMLSADDYTAEVALLRREAAGQTTSDPGTDGLYRLLSYQGLSVTSDALVTFLWTAQSVQAAALTLLQAGARTGRSYLVSYLWGQYGSAATRPDVARTVDFAYGGFEPRQ